MTAAVEPNPEATRPELTEDYGGPPGSLAGRRGGMSLRVGVAVLWLSVIVLLPLAAILWQSAKGGWSAFVSAVTSPSAVDSFRVTLTVSASVTVVNVVLGLLVAWVLVRDDFPGKRIVDALIDLPFALPTIVASVVLLSLYGPHSPVGVHLQHTPWGVGIALLFVTLPFVVRAVQPVLLEVDREAEQAAASLGANNWTIFTKIILPGTLPYVLTGLRLGLAQAWRILIGVEMLAAVPWGLGWMIFGAREFLNMDVMLAGVAVIAIIGLALEKLVFQRLEQFTVVRWGMMT